MNAWFNTASIWEIYLVIVLLILGGKEIGTAFALRDRERPASDADRLLSSLAIPSIGLLALIIGFTFSMALSRFEARRLAVLSEANAIGTAALRGQMLPEPYKSTVAPLFKEYAMIRIVSSTETAGSPKIDQAIRRSLEIQDELWHAGMEAAAANPQGVPSGLFIQALNTMIDVHEERLSAARNQVPLAVFALLEGIAIIAFAFEGYSLQLAKMRNRGAIWLMAAMIGSVIMLIVDLDRPQGGFITVDQRPLLDFLGDKR